MSKTTKPKRSFTKILISIVIGLVISVIVGAILAWLITWIFPEVNPFISQLITAFGLPYEELIMKAGWFGFSFVAGLLLTMMFNLPVQWIRARIAKRRQVRSAS